MADPRDDLSGAVAAWLAETGKPRKLLLCQAREHLRPARRFYVLAFVGHWCFA
jgi:hypothetical protein